MQAPFHLVIWRDGVCAGDDVDAPHALVLSAPRGTSLRDLVGQCLERRYLASISGGRATWILASTRPLAVIAQQWTEPRFLVAPESPVLSLIDATAVPHLHFRYGCQADPDETFARFSSEEQSSVRSSAHGTP